MKCQKFANGASVIVRNVFTARIRPESDSISFRIYDKGKAYSLMQLRGGMSN